MIVLASLRHLEILGGDTDRKVKKVPTTPSTFGPSPLNGAPVNGRKNLDLYAGRKAMAMVRAIVDSWWRM